VSGWTVEKALSWATLVAVLAGLIAGANQCSRGFDKIADHEKRITEIEAANKVGDKEVADKLQKIQSAVDFMNWRMDGVTKQLEGKKR
jgi:hypothetical protein